MTQSKRSMLTWPIALFMLIIVPLLAACSGGGDQLLLAEFNRDGEAEIFLAELRTEQSEWQSLAKDVERAFLFPGEYATFVPDSNTIVLWYIDRNDLRVEQIEIGDEAPTELFETDANGRVFGTIETDPYAVYLTETRDFDDYRCHVSVEGAEAARLARGTNCTILEKGIVLRDFDNNSFTATLISLDGEDETVILDEAEDIMDIRWNDDLSTFVYVEIGRRDAQLFLISPGDEAGEEFGDEFAAIESFGFLPDGETVYVIGKLDEDDDELGLFVNGTGDAVLEAPVITRWAQPENGDYVVFVTDDGDEEVAYVYSVADETSAEVVEVDDVSNISFVTEDRFLLTAQDRDDVVLMSALNDGSESVELFKDDNYTIEFGYFNTAVQQAILQLQDADGLYSLFVTGLEEEDGYFLVEEWDFITILNASEEYLVFSGQEDQGDDPALFSIAWEPDASETELDDDAQLGYRNVFFAEDGRSIYYTALEEGLGSAETRQVLLDGSERAEQLYRDMLILDVNWDGEPNLQFIR